MNRSRFRFVKPVAMITLAGLCLVTLCSCGGATEEPTPRPTEALGVTYCEPPFQPAADLLGDAVNEWELDGGALLLFHQGRTVCEAYYGRYDGRTPVPLVSAAKWYSAAAIMTLVDDGSIGLDDPVSDYLPTFTGDHGRMTMRQLLSHTSGLPEYAGCMFESEITLEECAEMIADVDLIAAPGAEFHYGGTAYTVAGRVAEVASDMSWGALFRARIAQPLMLGATDYGATRNPMLSEGYVTSSLYDYGVFLIMLLNEGRVGERQVLSAGAVDEMLSDQITEAVVDFSPRGENTRYGLGAWIDRVGSDGEPTQISSPGGGGFVPWIDLERDLVGVFAVAHRIEFVWETVLEVQQVTRDGVDEQSSQ